MAKQTVTREANQIDFNRLQLQDELEAIQPTASLSVSQERDENKVALDPATLSLTYDDADEAALQAALLSHIPIETEEETGDNKNAKGTPRDRKRLLKTLNKLSPNQRSALKAFMQQLLAE